MSKSNAFETGTLLSGEQVLIPLEQVAGPANLIGDPLPVGLRDEPKFEIFESVVGAVSVEMVDALVGEQRAPEVFCHDPSVLSNEPMPTAHRIEQRDVCVRDGSETQFNVPCPSIATPSCFGGGGGSLPTCTVRSAAGLAGSTKPWLADPLPDRAHRIPSAYTASRADHFQARSHVSIHPQEGRSGVDNGRVLDR